ncbi:hypothetical protein [Pseudonocardia broussonetiae]|uniref:Fe-S oxidoreductase n=1 Tax=Pseudonocardia broussonetiae TaxID=2736640 RepID=A0A6M6JF49_9PSEU|nr:hypothetical protein [Pseudonocardia broussonetiae]QJY45700.1 hypothetical protein HOP40_07700 [Pseudonocardia broussonetiae]
MSSLARRSLRTTAAAAGIAALGVGFAGHALAAPALPALPGTEGLSEAGLPAAPALPAAPEAPATPGLPSAEGWSVPGVVNFEMPAVNTAAPELPAGDAFALPTAPELAVPEAPAAPELPAAPEAPSTSPVVNSGEGVEGQVNGPAPEGVGQNQVGAMAAMDMAAMLAEMAQSGAAGGSITENQQIG